MVHAAGKRNRVEKTHAQRASVRTRRLSAIKPGAVRRLPDGRRRPPNARDTRRTRHAPIARPFPTLCPAFPGYSAAPIAPTLRHALFLDVVAPMQTPIDIGSRTTAPSVLHRVLALLAACALLAAAFATIVRPWYWNWGATPEERRATFPSDRIVANPAGRQTRAITIDAPPDRVWPWVAQLGQDRGGFYSYDLLENLVGCEMPTADRLRPDRQQWNVGDTLWLYPPRKGDGQGYMTLRRYVPERVLGFSGRAFGTPPTAPDNGSWSFILQPIGSSGTRLLIRGQGAASRSLLGRTFDRSIFDPAHFVMERRMMIGIKQLAEGGTRHRVANHWAVLSWLLVFGVWVTAAVRVLRGIRWRASLATFVASAAIFQVLTLAQPSAVVGWWLAGLAALLLRAGGPR